MTKNKRHGWKNKHEITLQMNHHNQPPAKSTTSCLHNIQPPSNAYCCNQFHMSYNSMERKRMRRRRNKTTRRVRRHLLGKVIIWSNKHSNDSWYVFTRRRRVSNIYAWDALQLQVYHRLIRWQLRQELKQWHLFGSHGVASPMPCWWQINCVHALLMCVECSGIVSVWVMPDDDRCCCCCCASTLIQNNATMSNRGIGGKWLLAQGQGTHFIRPVRDQRKKKTLFRVGCWTNEKQSIKMSTPSSFNSHIHAPCGFSSAIRYYELSEHHILHKQRRRIVWREIPGEINYVQFVHTNSVGIVVCVCYT